MLFTISIIGFLLLTALLGHAILSRNSARFATDEYITLCLGTGLAATPLLFWTFKLLHLPLYWAYFVPLILLALLRGKPHCTGWTRYSWCALILTILHFTIFTYGAFQYPYLEDSDPLYHAVGARYVSDTHSTGFGIAKYLEPYPPFYDILMGLIVQTNHNIVWTLKVVNALIVSLGILFAFFATRRLFDERTAIWTTLILTLIPSYLSHFIFAASLSITLIWPAIHLLPTQHWKTLAIVLSGIFLTQPLTATAFLLIYLLYIFFHGQNHHWKSLALALLLTSTYWGFVFYKQGILTPAQQIGISMLIGDDTSQGITYTLTNFLIPPNYSQIDTSIGWGAAITLLLILGITSKPPYWKWLTTWLAFIIIGLESNYLPVHFIPHRLWPYAAIPVVILAGHAAARAATTQKTKILIIIGLLITAGLPKITTNTAEWPRGPEWTSTNEAKAYTLLQNIGTELTILAPCTPSWKINANNHRALTNPAIKKFNASEHYQHARENNADLLLFDETCITSNYTTEEQLRKEGTQLNILPIINNPSLIALPVLPAAEQQDSPSSATGSHQK